MVIKKKIEKNLEQQRAAVIEKGGHVGADQIINENAKQSIVLRIPQPLLNDVDEKVKKRYGITRTGWILEAIQEKLEKE